MRTSEAAGGGTRPIREARKDGEPFAVYSLEAWEREHPGLAAGITAAHEAADFASVRTPAWTFFERAEMLGAQLGFAAVAIPRQVHGSEVRAVDGGPSRGFLSPGRADGLATARRGLLLGVTAADCVPVYVLAPASGALALLHAGWRGAAGRILERGLLTLRSAYGAEPSELRLHFGPAICGDCYEVGEEVLSAFGHDGAAPGHVDLRGELLGQALELGVREESVTRSEWCTRCARDRFHSHRGSQESAGRMAAFLGWRTGV